MNWKQRNLSRAVIGPIKKTDGSEAVGLGEEGRLLAPSIQAQTAETSSKGGPKEETRDSKGKRGRAPRLGAGPETLYQRGRLGCPHPKPGPFWT